MALSFSDRFNAMPKHVVSSSLERAEWNRAAACSPCAWPRPAL